MTAVIYKITNKISGKFYIGSAVDFDVRKASHLAALKRGDHHNPGLLRAWRKYGPDAFSFSIIETVEYNNFLLDREGEIIRAERATDRRYGYNVCHFSWSMLGRTMPAAEVRAKIGAANRGKKRSPEFCQAMSESRIGQKLGPCSPEKAAKISAAQKGIPRKPLTEQHRLKLSKAHKGRLPWSTGRTLSDAHRAAISLGLMGKKRGPMSQETKKKLSDATKRQHARGLTLRGERAPRAKLRDSDIVEIRLLAVEGLMHKEIAERFGVGRKAITKIVNRQRWRHILDESVRDAKVERP